MGEIRRADSRQAARSAYAADGFDPPEALQLSGSGGDTPRREIGGDRGGLFGEEPPSLSLPGKKSADVFACGVLIFWTLTYGQHPYGEGAAPRAANLLRGEAVNLPALTKLPEARQLVAEARVVGSDIRHLEQNLGLPEEESLNLVTVLVGLFCLWTSYKACRAVFDRGNKANQKALGLPVAKEV